MAAYTCDAVSKHGRQPLSGELVASKERPEHSGCLAATTAVTSSGHETSQLVASGGQQAQNKPSGNGTMSFHPSLDGRIGKHGIES